MSAEKHEQKVFRVEGFGEVGEANLWAFIPLKGEKIYQDLEIGESTTGYASGCANRKLQPERITRVK